MSKTLALASLALAGVAAAAPSKPMPPTQAVKSLSQAGLKWETDPESKVSIAVVTGNPKTGAYEAFLKFPSGMSIPLHWHSFSNTGVGVSGKLVIDAQGQGKIEMGPGDWGFIPARVKHTTACTVGADCVIYARQPGKDDIHFDGPGGKDPPRK